MQTQVDNAPVSGPGNTNFPQQHIVALTTSTKVLYSLFNFFAPIAIVGMLVGRAIEEKGGVGIFGVSAVVLSVVIGLLCMILNLLKYNRFLCIDGAFIHICKGKKDAPTILESLPLEALQKQLTQEPVVKYNGKKKKLLHASVSIIGLICWLGPMTLVLLGHCKTVAMCKMAELYALAPTLFEKEVKAPGKTGYIVLSALFWLAVAFGVLVGLPWLLDLPSALGWLISNALTM